MTSQLIREIEFDERAHPRLDVSQHRQNSCAFEMSPVELDTAAPKPLHL